MALWPALFSRPAQTQLPTRPSLTLFFCLSGAFLLTLLPHVGQLPPWLSVTIIFTMMLRCLLEWFRLPLPSTNFTASVALCLFAAVWWQYQTILGRDAGTAFMAGLLAIKFYELRGPRDIAMIIFSGFFVVMSALLYSQVLELFIYCLIMMWVLTALLLRTQMGDAHEDHLLGVLRWSGVIFLQALPLAAFFFFFLPRYTGKFQLVLRDAPIGLTDRVAPGSISSLANDDSVAMYVKFDSGDVPTPDTMYWRALVLWDYHHGVWTQGALAALPDIALPTAAPGSNTVVQEITAWPHFQGWLFALDYPVTPAVNASESGLWSTTLYGGVLQLRYGGRKLDHKERYTVTSSDQLAGQVLEPKRADGRSNPEYVAATQLPNTDADAIDQRVVNLADRLYKKNPDPEAYLFAVLHYFRHEHFIYTTSPGAMPNDWLPTFLFEKKAGFCEHFASAFAVLMRQEKIPARVVVGYRGAEYNPYDGLYTVRQSNAHAWDEVWIAAKKHWIRVDPAALVPLGPGAGLASGNGDQSDESSSIQVTRHQLTFSETYVPDWVRHTIFDLQLRRQQIEANWDDWVFSYDPETQNRMARALGFGRESLLLACLLATGIFLIVFQRLMKEKQPVSPVEDLYARFCRNMAQHGIPRAKWEGPLAYTERAAEAFPEKKQAIHDVGKVVARWRYGAPPVEPATPKHLQSLLAEITASPPSSSSRE